MLPPLAGPRAAIRRRRPATLAGLLASLLLLGACLTQSQGKAHGLVNESRARAGVHQLAHDSQAQAKAQAWAENLASRNQLAHSRLSDGMDGWKAIAENVGWGSSIEHVHQHSSGHSDAIVTEDQSAARRFVSAVDSAAVLVNASTRFTDGGEFGFGAEIGISTQKLHARGPMCLPEMTSTKYVVTGDGHVR